MNWIHRWLCRSPGWRNRVRERIPWALEGADLGPEVLEVGPGPGLTTDVLRPRTARLTALEIDSALASSLAARFLGTNVTVIRGDATSMPFANAQFSGAVCFTMLHHVPSPRLQDKLLDEVLRVLVPGGMFVGVDSQQSLRMRLIHIGDTLVPVDPNTFRVRLEAAGFRDVLIETNKQAFRFRAYRPPEPATHAADHVWRRAPARARIPGIAGTPFGSKSQLRGNKQPDLAKNETAWKPDTDL